MREHLASPFVINKDYAVEIAHLIHIDEDRALNFKVDPERPTGQYAIPAIESRGRHQVSASLIDKKIAQVIATQDDNILKLPCIEHFLLLTQYEEKVFDRLYESAVDVYKLINCDVVQRIQTNKLINRLQNRCDRNKIAELAAWLTELYYGRRRAIEVWHRDHIERLPF
jgi:hypothetical protein